MLRQKTERKKRNRWCDAVLETDKDAPSSQNFLQDFIYEQENRQTDKIHNDKRQEKTKGKNKVEKMSEHTRQENGNGRDEKENEKRAATSGEKEERKVVEVRSEVEHDESEKRDKQRTSEATKK